MTQVAQLRPVTQTKEAEVPEDIKQEPVNTALVAEGEALFAFGDEENVPPKQLVPAGTELEVRIVGIPKIQAGQGQPSEKYPLGYRYAFLKLSALPVDEARWGDCEFISGDIRFPSPDDSVAQQNDKARQFQAFRQAIGWTPPRGLVPLQANGMEFPELKDATVRCVVTQKFDDFRGGMENVIQRFVAEKG